MFQNGSWVRIPKPIYGGRVARLLCMSVIDGFDNDKSVLTNYFPVCLDVKSQDYDFKSRTVDV